MKDDKINITFIAECIDQIQQYTLDGRATFFQNVMIQDAVVRNFEVIGEATKNFSNELRLANPEVPCQKIAGFRDGLIHNYIDVDPEVGWEIIEDELPDLKEKIDSIATGFQEEI